MNKFNLNITFPNQKLPESSKNEEWRKQNVDAAETLILNQNQYTRNSRYSKLVNYDLYAGKLHPSDMELIMNPLGLKDVHFPARPLNHSIINPYIKTLIGEEIKRRFDYHLKVNNEDAISEKEKSQIESYQQLIEQILLEGLEQPQEQTEEAKAAFEAEIEKRLRQKKQYMTYEWQDVREIAGTRLLKYYTQKNNLPEAFMRGFEDSLICAEEIYRIDVENNEPVVYKCNPLNTYFLLPPNSNRVEDCDIIIEEDYIPVSKVIDDYYEYLKPSEIDWLGERTMYKAKGTYGGPVNYELQDPTFAIPFGFTNSININQVNVSANSYLAFDSQNNVRRVKVVWRSLRKVGVLSYIDELGQPQETYVPETYKVNKEAGESVKWIWIGEWWEGTKLANEIYIKMQPRPIQFRTLNNLSKCASGYVGTIYKTNSSQPQSLLDIMKSYQYLYNVIYHRTQLAFAKNIGKVANLDLAKMPAGWEPDKWLYYMREMGLAVTDSFNEAKKGAATGKLAGNMSSNQAVLDLDMGNYIQQHIEMLQYIKTELDLVTGITPQRRGQYTSSDQGLGVTQENKLASSNITEWYYKIHDNTKVRVLSHLLETAKYCLRNGNKNIQYIEDDYTTKIYQVDGELVNESEYDLFIRDAVEDGQAIEMLRKATEIGLQTGQVNIIQLMDIYSNQSLASIRRKIEKSVAEAQEQAQQAQQMQLQQQKAIEDQKVQVEMEKLRLKQYEIDQNNQTKIAIAEMQAYAIDEGSAPELIDRTAEYAFKQQEISQKAFNEQEKLRHAKEVKDKELELKRKELDERMKIENKKLEQIEVQNKNQEYLKELDVKMKKEELNAKKEIEKIKLQAAKSKARSSTKK
jgi:hypothetical protein